MRVWRHWAAQYSRSDAPAIQLSLERGDPRRSGSASPGPRLGRLADVRGCSAGTAGVESGRAGRCDAEDRVCCDAGDRRRPDDVWLF